MIHLAGARPKNISRQSEVLGSGSKLTLFANRTSTMSGSKMMVRRKQRML